MELEQDDEAPAHQAAKSREDQSSAGNSDPVAVLQDEEFWYDDGSIVLSTASVAFKVYQGPLVQQSAVFRDMLSLPQPPSSPEASGHYDCPVINLSDSPSDLRHILRIIMPNKELM